MGKARRSLRFEILRLFTPLVALLALARTGGGVESATVVLSDFHAYYWNLTNANAPWSGRTGHVALDFRGQLWVLGGSIALNPDNSVNDEWNSVDGTNWIQASAAAPWSARTEHAAVVFQEKMWVASGRSASDLTLFNDLWSSPDGLHWDPGVSPVPWSTREGVAVAANGDNLYLLGGQHYGTFLAEIWRLNLNLEWVAVAPPVPWASRSQHQSLWFHDTLWVLGGVHFEGSTSVWLELNDVWNSPDGSSWTQATPHAGWHGRNSHTATVFDNRLWVLGGTYIEGVGPGSHLVTLNDVWYSENGADWHQAPDAPWAARSGHAALAFAGKLWVLGGTTIRNHDFELLNDVWCLTPVPMSIEAEHASPYQVGEALTLHVAGPGLPPGVTYQWMKDGVALAGESSDRYHLAAAAEGATGSYTCEIGGSAFGTAGPAVIVVSAAQRVPVGAAVLGGAALGVLFLGARRLRR